MDVKCFLGFLGVFKGDESVVEGGTGEMKKQEEKEDWIKEHKERFGVEPNLFDGI